MPSRTRPPEQHEGSARATPLVVRSLQGKHRRLMARNVARPAAWRVWLSAPTLTVGLHGAVGEFGNVPVAHVVSPVATRATLTTSAAHSTRLRPGDGAAAKTVVPADMPADRSRCGPLSSVT